MRNFILRGLVYLIDTLLWWFQKRRIVSDEVKTVHDFVSIFWPAPKEPEPKFVFIPEYVQQNFKEYIAKCYNNRTKSFKVSKKMRKYKVGQVVDGYRGGQYPDKPIRGAVLGSYSQYGGGGYFIMKIPSAKIIQVFSVRPVLE